MAPTESTETTDGAAASKANVEGDGLTYLRGFSNHHESESIPGTLPLGRNNPKLAPGNLYAEQISGTAFTSPRSENRRSWLYRVRPSVSGTGSGFAPCGGGGDGAPPNFGLCDWSSSSSSSSSSPPPFSGKGKGGADGGGLRLDPNPLRWGPTPLPSPSGSPATFLTGTRTMAGSGDPTTKSGVAVHVYAFDSDMTDAEGKVDEHMYSSDGDFLIVPQLGTLAVRTEMGTMTVRPTEICVLPRGVVFSVNVLRRGGVGYGAENGNEPSEDGAVPGARGYILEIFKGHFALPELGPIGSNGLANARDFLYPTASYETRTSVAQARCRIYNKFGGKMFVRLSPHSPYDVVAWHGNYSPYKYDLTNFCAVNSVTYDHIDPSVYTVLTAKSDEPGTALADFVVFPPRVLATDEDTFRPPWFHRNCMSEFMGLIYGEYDAKRDGFVPGGASLHNCMTPHGPDSDTYHKAVAADCREPTKFDGGMAFMFETCATLKVSEYALGCEHRELRYATCWDGLGDNFTEWNRGRETPSKCGGADGGAGKDGADVTGGRESKRARASK